MIEKNNYQFSAGFEVFPFLSYHHYEKQTNGQQKQFDKTNELANNQQTNIMIVNVIPII